MYLNRKKKEEKAILSICRYMMLTHATAASSASPSLRDLSFCICPLALTHELDRGLNCLAHNLCLFLSSCPALLT